MSSSLTAGGNTHWFPFKLHSITVLLTEKSFETQPEDWCHCSFKNEYNILGCHYVCVYV